LFKDPKPGDLVMNRLKLT